MTPLFRRRMTLGVLGVLVGLALVYALSGANPLVGTDIVPALAVATIVPAILYLASIPFGAGAFGQGDV